jgi:hypothetical protein
MEERIPWPMDCWKQSESSNVGSIGNTLKNLDSKVRKNRKILCIKMPIFEKKGKEAIQNSSGRQDKPASRG